LPVESIVPTPEPVAVRIATFRVDAEEVPAPLPVADLARRTLAVEEAVPNPDAVAVTTIALAPLAV